MPISVAEWTAFVAPQLRRDSFRAAGLPSRSPFCTSGFLGTNAQLPAWHENGVFKQVTLYRSRPMSPASENRATERGQ
jgi:hypothetical protein